jgi:GNAT superfamily N-acetyltransferase
MRHGDISFAVRLSDQEDWGIPTSDFARILRLDPRGSFIALKGARRVGLATTTRYGQQAAWIGNVVVAKSHRGKHIGQALVKHAIAFLERNRVKHIALYSFNENIEFYKRIGFIEGPRFARLRRERRPFRDVISQSITRKSMGLSSVLSMDRKAFGADRARLFTDLLNSGCAWYLGYAVGSSRSYLLMKRYEDMGELGPWVSFGLRPTELDLMLRFVLTKTGRMPIEVSCPLTNRTASAMLKKHHFRIIREGYMMSYSAISRMGQPSAIVAFGFLDKG